MPSRFAHLATVFRGAHPESWHLGAAAVVTPEDELVARVGSAGLETFLRSAAKPFQALPLVLEGGVGHWRLEAEDLALICASHQGSPEHVERAAALLDRAGLGVESLGCGPHWPLDAASRTAMRAAGDEPGRLHNNCSGKHAGLLLAARQLGLPLDGYLEPAHPLQRRILSLLSLICGVAEEGIGMAVDGCGLPSYRLPLRAAARAWAALADPGAACLPAEVAGALGEIVAAMTQAPRMVSGRETFTTRLLEVTGGRILGKEGFEGVYAVAVRGPVALGVTLKVADGGERARPGVVLDLLRQLGSLSAAEMASLDRFRCPPVENAAGDVVGRVEPDVELEAVGEERAVGASAR